MTNKNILNQLIDKNIISAEVANQIEIDDATKPFSIHWELRTLLYLGISLLMAGLGILIYKNIDTIGHGVLIGLIALLCGFCFYYSFKHAKPFSWQEISDTGKLTDFALLAACLLFLALEGYVQYQYNLFGNRYGLAALFPAIIFFISSYWFDHRGVLSMAITALTSSIGISITPVTIWQSDKLNTQSLVISAIILGVILVIVGFISEKQDLKKHFSFTYLLYGSNMVFLAALTGLFGFDYKVIYFLIIILMSLLSIYYARKTHSYLFVLMGVVFGYTAFTYSFFNLLPNDYDFFTYQFYFFASAGGIIYFLLNIRKIVKSE